MGAVNRRMWKTHAYRSALPDVQPEPSAEPTAVKPPTLTRGGTPQHTHWFRVMAPVMNANGLVDYDFVAEAPTNAEAVTLANRYEYRAVVIDASCRRTYINGKAIEAP